VQPVAKQRAPVRQAIHVRVEIQQMHARLLHAMTSQWRQ
jgi:hypothetical protein